MGADIVALSLSHPLSPGLIVELPETADRTEVAGRILGSSSFKLFDGAGG